MGIDCVYTCIYTPGHPLGPSSDIESYVQECGGASRNGFPSNAVLENGRFLDSKARKWNFIAGAKKSAEGLSSCLILTVLTVALQVVNAVMFVLLNTNVQHLVVIVILFPFHCVKLQATIIPSTCIYA